jgi:hypothetical protein
MGKNQAEANINRNSRRKWKWIGHTLRKPPSKSSTGMESTRNQEKRKP